MTRADLIELIADILTRIDVTRSELDLGTPERTRLDGLRDRLDADLRHLIRTDFALNTPAIESATDDLVTADAEINKTIDDLTRIAQTVAAVANAVKVVGKIVDLVAPIF